MDSVIGAVTVINLIIDFCLLLFVQIRGNRVRTGRLWLSLAILTALVATASLLLPTEIRAFGSIFDRGFITVLLLASVLTMTGALVIRDISNRTPVLWLVLNAVWLGSILAVGLTTPPPVPVGEPEWLLNAFTMPSVASVVPLAGLVLMAIVLLGTAFYAFYAAKLPEVANRALFWVLDIAMVLMGVVLIMSGTDVLMLIGLLLLPVGIIGATYAQVSYRVFDIRNELGSALRTLALIMLTTVIIYIAISIASTLEADNERAAVVFATLALAAALVYVPLRQLAENITRRLMRNSLTDPTEATRRYSHEVSQAVELDQLVDIATRTLNQVMRARRSGLILVDSVGDAKRVEWIVMTGGGAPETKGYFSKASPVHRQLSQHHVPVSQFDIEFSPDYKDSPAAEREFLQSLGMSAYAPINVENTLIGILACGPKVNDVPFYPQDLALLATMADQTGVALRNARLVADLRNLNEGMKSLNKGLEDAKVQMEKLDSVKTDFVTIASHELRTPLAQIRGYTDIMDALNEQSALNKDQMTGLVLNLRKATERMEELISAMLDVSQLDVNAMDLRFTQSSLESVIRMSIEPLTDAIKQRKLTLSARGLRGLPTIQADMQRLVQAFRNVVLNSIKFTPDGGRIEISARLQTATKAGERDHILVSISDTGVGIAKENLELIFQKFFRAYDPSLHSTGAHKFLGAGPGLGLTIAKGVIEGHGGKIWAESPGHNMETFPGTTFFVLLPVSPPEDAKRVMPFEGTGENVTSPTEPTLIRSQL